MTDTLDWSHATTEVGEHGLKRTRAATAEERNALVGELALSSCEALDATYDIRALGGGRFGLTGTMTARLAQPCGVTLDPVTAQMTERFEVEFHPELPAGDTGDEEREILSSIDVEGIEGGHIHVGRIVHDTLSASLNPYPRKDGADFDWSDPKAASPGTSPFAVLKNLKRDT